MRNVWVLVGSLAWAVVARGGAGEAPAFGHLAVGDARLAVGRDGRFALSCGGEVVVSDTRLVVAAPGWKGVGSQATCRVLEGYPRRDGAALVCAGEIVEPKSGVAWRFEQRVAAEGDAFRIACAIEPARDTQVGEISLFLDLPAARWRGRTVLFVPGSAKPFPEKPPPERHFLSGMARRVVLDVDGARQVALDFARPTLCTAQDCREFGRPGYQLYPRLFRGGAARKGQRLTLEFLLRPNDKRRHTMATADTSSKAPLRIGELTLPAKSVPRYARLELDLDVSGTWHTPFDPDQVRVDGHVRTPSGRELVVPAFYSQDFELMRQDDAGWLEPREKRGWKLRFAATEVGRHSLAVTARDRSGEVRSDPVEFEATPSDDPGYIRVSAKDRRYFAFDSGKPYFAVGENVCTWRKGVHQYDTWLPKLGKAGGNYARIWTWAHCFGVEWGKPGHYRLDHAWALDHAMGLAEKHGIHVKLCLEAWRHFEGRRSFVKAGVLHPYAKRNGGPCETEMDVFTDPEAKRMFRNRLRYVVARWGYSTHILAWEFWNEINCVRGYGARSQDVMDWTVEMARHLKQIDPWQHLVVNSLGSFLVDDRMWTPPEVDFAQVHGYWHPTHAASKEMGKDMAEFVPHWIAKIRGYGKPALFAEYGLVKATWGHSPRADEDTDGVHLHNGLWSSVMTGAAGTAMLWWWGIYVEPNDLYYHFAAVARYVEGVPWTTAAFKPAAVKAGSPQLRVAGLQGKGLTLLWLQNRQHTWWHVVEKQPIPAINAATVALSGLADGQYQVEWWDTWKGVVTKREVLEAVKGTLSLAVPRLERDVAVKLLRR